MPGTSLGSMPRTNLALTYSITLGGPRKEFRGVHAFDAAMSFKTVILEASNVDAESTDVGWTMNPTFFLDGSTIKFPFVGVDRIKVQSATRTVFAHIGVPANLPNLYAAYEFIILEIRKALKITISRLEKMNILVSGEMVNSTLDGLETRFLGAELD